MQTCSKSHHTDQTNKPLPVDPTKQFIIPPMILQFQRRHRADLYKLLSSTKDFPEICVRS